MSMNIKQILFKAALCEDDIIKILSSYKHSCSVLLNYSKVFLSLQNGTIKIETTRLKTITFETLLKKEILPKMSTSFWVIQTVDSWFQNILFEQEKQVLFYRFIDVEWNGLTYKGLTYREIADLLGMRFQKCQHMAEKAIKKIAFIEN